MARKPFVVIDAEILSSSVWSEAPHTRLVWLTMLILCDTEGYVGASVPGIARAAGVSLDEARESILRLQEPDPDSRTKSDEGRRVKLAERGFQILNFKEHLDRLSKERAKSRERVRKFRARKRQQADGNVTVTTGNREQGVGNRDETEERQEEPPALPPADRAERAIQQTTDALRTKLYTLVSEMTDEDPKHRDPTQLMQLVTAYDKTGGGRVKGVVNAHLLTHERVEKSISDAEAILADWRQKRGA